ncbi:MAG: DVU0772 family protein [Thermodesulfobacteriota bacterium]
MMNLEQLKQKTDIIYDIDWEMTPEEAVRLYLEWGNNWVYGKYVIQSKADESYYFVVYAWDDPPVIYLIRRNSEDAEELAEIALPDHLRHRFLESIGHNKGVYALDGELRQWLKKQVGMAQ